MTNPCQDPTPEQEAMHELHCEIAALREQIVEAWRIISIAHDEIDGRYDGCEDSSTLWMGELIDQSKEWLDQNESIAKECAK